MIGELCLRIGDRYGSHGTDQQNRRDITVRTALFMEVFVQRAKSAKRNGNETDNIETGGA
jgi:hypothetical protein